MKRFLALLMMMLASPFWLAWAGDVSKNADSSKGVNTKRFLVAAGAALDEAALKKTGCKIIQRMGSKPGELALVQCGGNPDGVVAAASVNNWTLKTATEYKNLGTRDSVALAVMALISPDAVSDRKMSYYFPAQGDSSEKRREWLKNVLLRTDQVSGDLNVVLVDKGGRYFAFKPSATEKVLPVSTIDYGVSVDSEDFASFVDIYPLERDNAQRIVSK